MSKRQLSQRLTHILNEFPYHVKIDQNKGSLYMVDWLFEKGPATTEWTIEPCREEWIHQTHDGWRTEDRVFDIYAFKHKRDAILFKILWEHRDPRIKWVPGHGGLHLEN